MNARPILFSGEMVRAILDGRKTQTRRVLRPSNSIVGTGTPWDHLDFGADDNPALRTDGDERNGYLHVPHSDGETAHRVYPRIEAGDLLWVRETWRAPMSDSPDDLDDTRRVCIEYAASEGHAVDEAHEWREVLGEHVDVGAWCERWLDRNRGGWQPSIYLPKWAARLFLRVVAVRVERLDEITPGDVRAEGVVVEQYAALWESINGKGSWAANPWVWVVTFERAARPAGWPS